jgi:MFS family permease
MMLGGAALAVWKGFRNRVKTLLLANLVWAVCTFALGFVPWFWLYLVFMGFFGVGMPLFNAPMMTIIQEHVEGEYMGRVFGVNTMLSTSVMPIAMLIFGPYADRVQDRVAAARTREPSLVLLASSPSPTSASWKRRTGGQAAAQNRRPTPILRRRRPRRSMLFPWRSSASPRARSQPCSLSVT